MHMSGESCSRGKKDRTTSVLIIFGQLCMKMTNLLLIAVPTSSETNLLLIAVPTILLTFALSHLFGEMRSQSKDTPDSCGVTSEKTIKLFTSIKELIKRSSNDATRSDFLRNILASLYNDEKILLRDKREEISANSIKNKALSEIDPTLLKGNIREAGIKVRLNPALFYYASTITRYILDKEITRVHLAEIIHQIQQVK
uniref:Inner membrane protein n=1 Tax=Ascaris lumbricoides TaxID=6252 RepID=A0A0M3HGE0_ASCLU